MTKYVIVKAGIGTGALDDAAKELEQRVNDLLKRGWEPAGGVAQVEGIYACLMQAMVKPSK